MSQERKELLRWNKKQFSSEQNNYFGRWVSDLSHKLFQSKQACLVLRKRDTDTKLNKNLSKNVVVMHEKNLKALG